MPLFTVKYNCYSSIILLVRSLLLIAVWGFSVQCKASPQQDYRPAANLFLDRCASCHGSDGLGEGYISRLIPGYPSVNLLENPEKRNYQEVRDVIEFGNSLEGISKFSPPWGAELSGKEIDQLTDLVFALRGNTDETIEIMRREGDTRRASVSLGALTFRTSCVICHGAKGKGDGRLSRLYKKPPPADLTSSSLSLEEVREIVYKGGEAVGRSASMPSWQGTFNKQEIDSAIQYILTLRKN